MADKSGNDVSQFVHQATPKRNRDLLRLWPTVPAINFEQAVLTNPVTFSTLAVAATPGKLLLAAGMSHARRRPSLGSHRRRRLKIQRAASCGSNQRSDMQDSPASILAISVTGSGTTFTPCFASKSCVRR